MYGDPISIVHLTRQKCSEPGEGAEEFTECIGNTASDKGLLRLQSWVRISPPLLAEAGRSGGEFLMYERDRDSKNISHQENEIRLVGMSLNMPLEMSPSWCDFLQASVDID